jgi:hypothetical protein
MVGSCVAVQDWVVPKHGDDADARAAIGAPGAKVIFLILVQVVVRNKDDGECIRWYGCMQSIKHVIEIELARGCAIRGWPEPHTCGNAVCCHESNLPTIIPTFLFLNPSLETEVVFENLDIQARIEGC